MSVLTFIQPKIKQAADQLGISETDFIILLYKDLCEFLEVNEHDVKKALKKHHPDKNELYTDLINECFKANEPFEYKIHNKWTDSIERLSVQVYNIKTGALKNEE